MSNACDTAAISEMIPKPIDCVVSKREVARQLGVSERNVDRLFGDGSLAVVEISPRRVGALQSDVDAFKRARRVIRGSKAAQDQAA